MSPSRPKGNAWSSLAGTASPATAWSLPSPSSPTVRLSCPRSRTPTSRVRAGRLYRAVLLGSGAHILAVRHMLRTISRHAYWRASRPLPPRSVH